MDLKLTDKRALISVPERDRFRHRHGACAGGGTGSSSTAGRKRPYRRPCLRFVSRCPGATIEGFAGDLASRKQPSRSAQVPGCGYPGQQPGHLRAETVRANPRLREDSPDPSARRPLKLLHASPVTATGPGGPVLDAAHDFWRSEPNRTFPEQKLKRTNDLMRMEKRGCCTREGSHSDRQFRYRGIKLPRSCAIPYRTVRCRRNGIDVSHRLISEGDGTRTCNHRIDSRLHAAAFSPQAGKAVAVVATAQGRDFPQISRI